MNPRLTIKMWALFACTIFCLVASGFAQSDPTFDAQVDKAIYAMIVQPDGKIVVGGQLTSLDGVPRGHIGRFNSNGTLDTGFDPEVDNYVYTTLLLPDGGLLIGGRFTHLGGLPRAHLARLNPDGTLDPTFTVEADNDVYALELQPDGKILVAGNFSTLAGQPSGEIGRLNADGTPDVSFSADAGSAVYTMALQPDGKILVGGAFGFFNGQNINFICRLNTNGTLDTNFVGSAANHVHSLAVQPNGKILVGGLFTSMDGQPRNNLARLNADGTLDTGFVADLSPGGYISDASSLVLESDGHIWVGGSFLGIGGQAIGGLARLHADGSVDTNFPGVGGTSVYSLALQRDGRVLRSTYYTIARLTNAPPSESFNRFGSILMWLRGGSSPEVRRTTFESSPNLSHWNLLGEGTRISGGWQLTGISAPANAYIRARGFVSGGYFNSSHAYVEAYQGPVVILSQPESRTNNAGSSATFTVLADGSPTLTYQWQKNGSDLTDSGNISGATTPTLTISNVLHADAAAYSCVIGNSYGNTTSDDASLTVVDPFLLSPPTNQFVNAGETALFSVVAYGTTLSYQWLRDGSPMTGETNASLALTNVQGADSGSTFSVIVSNTYGSLTSSVARLDVNAAIVDALNPTPNYPVYSVAVQPDGKILMNGNFSFVSGQLRVGVARLNGDGSLDTNFVGGLSGIPNSTADYEVALQTDGKILIAGRISKLDGTPRNRNGRLNPDGSLDIAFNPGAGPEVYAMTPQPDGKILLAGSFTNLANQLCNGIGRLNNDGTYDTNFTASTDGEIHAIALQPDGKVLVGGSFTNLDGQSRTNLGRLNADGTLDLSFNPGADSAIKAIAGLADGSIVVGGDFTSLAGQACSHLGRLDPNGALDIAFHPAPDGPVETLAADVNGGIVLGGTFTTVGGQSRTNIARLNADGSADLTFNPGANNTVLSVAVQPDGKIIAAGLFSVLNGQPRALIGRLNGSGNATNDFTFDSNVITWQRSGTGPEVWKTTFDFTTNGAGWTQVEGTRIAGGWQAGGLTLPAGTTVRGRGFVAGSSESSSWFVENGAGPAAIVSQPTSLTNNPFTLAQFAVSAAGQPPLSYRWLKDGATLDDSGNIFGAHSPLLNVSNVLGGDAALYQVVVSNTSGSVTSAVASLTVMDPLFTSQPTSRTNNAGQTATFTATAIGTTNLNYQWFKDGTNLTGGGNIFGAQTPTLTLTNVLGGDAGDYRVVVTNVWGSATSTVAHLTVVDPLLVTNPVSRFVNRGQSATFGVLVRGEEPLHYEWRKDGMDLTGGPLALLTLTNVQQSDAGGYDVVVTNNFGSVTSAVAALTVNTAIPDSVDAALNADVYGLALQPDGKILLGGNFTSVYGQSRNHIVRLNADGSLDAAFNPNASGPVFCLAVQPDGKILVGGSFTNLAGQVRNNLGRLNADGSLDVTFNPGPVYFYLPSSRVMSLLLQPDGKIVIGGVFTTVAGLPCADIARLYPDGSFDTNFHAAADGFVTTLAAQSDGKILVGGAFSNLSGQPRPALGRINADGTIDDSFTNVVKGSVTALVELADGGILVGGSFSQLDGQSRNNIARIAADGSLDTGFNPGANGSVYSFALQTDGRVVVGGSFGELGAQTRQRIGRLNADGSVDVYFNPVANGIVFSLAAQPDGDILAGGVFTFMSGQSHGRFARLSDESGVTESLFSDATSVTWLRGGASPELARTTFETTTNGTSWIALGQGARIPGGWQLDGLALPPNATLRARGFASSGGLQSSSMWFVESSGGAPLLSAQPVSRTNDATTTATFSAAGVGAPFQFQWLKNGANLSNGGNLSGATSATLTVSNVLGADAGGYSVVLSNASGSVTSAVATLTVIDPLLTSQPQSQFADIGQSTSFLVTALGTEPMSYQWRQDGVALTGATQPTLTLTDLQGTDAGGYDVIVSNAFGSVTSTVAVLTLNLAVPDDFNPGANGPVNTLAIQPDGKILVGGGFTTLGGQLRYRLGRLNSDGTLDAAFNPGGGPNDTNAYYNVSGLVLQPDGKILVAGSRGVRQIEPGSYVWRLDGAGNEDTNFVTPFASPINALAVEPGGSIWAGGNFLVGKPAVTTNLARLYSDGSLDSNFVASVLGSVNTIALQPDGKLLVGGSFVFLNGTNFNRIARFNADDTLDTSFNPNANSPVNALAVQPDGKILVGGQFTMIGGTNRYCIARLNPDGTLDTDFNPNANNVVSTLALQADGKILLGGAFTTIGGLARNHIARLNADGSVDATFNPGANSLVNALAIQPDGAILVGGGTYSSALKVLGGQSRTNIGRLVSTVPATQSLTFNNSSVAWLRGGTSPEVWRTTFEISSNGTDWVDLGEGTPMTGGWQLTGVSIPERAMIRARGFVTGGIKNGSGWFVESAYPTVIPPEILTTDGGLGFHPDLFGFNVLGIPGQTVVIEATTDFLSWTPIQTNLVTDSGFFTFADPQSVLFPYRFYRARLFNGISPSPAIVTGGNPFGSMSNTNSPRRFYRLRLK